MREFRDRHIHDLGLRSWPFSPRLVQSRVYISCFFDSCHNYLPRRPDGRLTIAGVELSDCANRACTLVAAILDEVRVQNLRTYAEHVFLLEACVFRHVKASGRIGFTKINQTLLPSKHRRFQRIWDDANAAFYADVDWALDISEAQFTFTPNLEAIPGRLIRRDPETQVLVTRASASTVDLSQLNWAGSSLHLGLKWFLEGGLYDEVVLVAAKGTSHFKRDLNAITMLRTQGIADAD